MDRHKNKLFWQLSKDSSDSQGLRLLKVNDFELAATKLIYHNTENDTHLAETL